MDRDYRSFWRWFEAAVLPTLARRDVPRHEVITELDRRVGALGLSWELGPSPVGGDGWALAISFGGDLDLLATARDVVAAAPRMLGCLVLLGKPPKEWNGVLDLPSSQGTTRFYTADWMCHLVPMDQGVAIMVDPVGVSDVEDDLLAEAVAIAVQSELGEHRVAEWVRDLSVVDASRVRELPGLRCRMRDLSAVPASVR